MRFYGGINLENVVIVQRYICCRDARYYDKSTCFRSGRKKLFRGPMYYIVFTSNEVRTQYEEFCEFLFEFARKSFYELFVFFKAYKILQISRRLLVNARSKFYVAIIFYV